MGKEAKDAKSAAGKATKDAKGENSMVPKAAKTMSKDEKDTDRKPAHTTAEDDTTEDDTTPEPELTTEERDRIAKNHAWAAPEQVTSLATSPSVQPGVYAVSPYGGDSLFADSSQQIDGSSSLLFADDSKLASKRALVDSVADGLELSRERSSTRLALQASCHNIVGSPEQHQEGISKRSPRFKCAVLLAIAVFVAIVVALVIVFLTGGNGQSSANSSVVSPTTVAPSVSPLDAELLLKCVESNGEQSLRYQDLRDALISSFPGTEHDMDIPHSAERTAMCWLADIDDLQMEASDIDGLIQRFALVTFAYATDYIILSNDGPQGWLTRNSVCDWSHVQCSESAVVKALSVSRLGLSGTLPTCLNMLTRLTDLDISENGFSGHIPRELWEMTQLERLIIGANRFVGTISARLGSLTELREFQIFSNAELTGNLPNFGTLLKLQHFSLLENLLITGTIPDLDGLTGLTSLQLRSVEISGTIPSSIGNLQKLETLELVHLDLTGTIPPEIGNATSIELLSLSYNHLAGPVPSQIGLLTSLAILELENLAQLSGSIPEEFGNLSNLAYFPLSESFGLEGILPEELCSLTEASIGLDLQCTRPCFDCCNQTLDLRCPE